MHGFYGRILKIDLTAGRCNVESLDDAINNYVPFGTDNEMRSIAKTAEEY